MLKEFFYSVEPDAYWNFVRWEICKLENWLKFISATRDSVSVHCFLFAIGISYYARPIKKISNAYPIIEILIFYIGEKILH